MNVTDIRVFAPSKDYKISQAFYSEIGFKPEYVSDITAAFELCSHSQHKTKISPVQQERWGQLFFLWGPVGELLQITQLNSQ